MFLDPETYSAAAAQLPIAPLVPEAHEDPRRGRTPPAAVDGQPGSARAHPPPPPDLARVHAAPRGRDGGADPRHRRRAARCRRPLRAVRPRPRADVPAAGLDRVQLHGRARGGLGAAQGVVRVARDARLGSPGAGRAGRARDEHGGLPPLSARARGRQGRRPRRRLRQRAARHPRRGPGQALPRGDRLDPLQPQLRGPRDDELPDRKPHPAAARGPLTLGGGRRRPVADRRRGGRDAALRHLGAGVAARHHPAGDARRGRVAGGSEAVPVAGGDRPRRGRVPRAGALRRPPGGRPPPPGVRQGHPLLRRSQPRQARGEARAGGPRRPLPRAAPRRRPASSRSTRTSRSAGRCGCSFTAGAGRRAPPGCGGGRRRPRAGRASRRSR